MSKRFLTKRNVKVDGAKSMAMRPRHVIFPFVVTVFRLTWLAPSASGFLHSRGFFPAQ